MIGTKLSYIPDPCAAVTMMEQVFRYIRKGASVPVFSSLIIHCHQTPFHLRCFNMYPNLLCLFFIIYNNYIFL